MESVKRVGLFLKPMALVLLHAAGHPALWPGGRWLVKTVLCIFIHTYIYWFLPVDCEASDSPGSSSGCLESLMFSKYPSAPAAPAEHGGLERIACREQDKTGRGRERERVWKRIKVQHQKVSFPLWSCKKGRTGERERDQDGKKSVGRKNVRLARYGSSCQGRHIALCNGNFW